MTYNQPSKLSLAILAAMDAAREEAEAATQDIRLKNMAKKICAEYTDDINQVTMGNIEQLPQYGSYKHNICAKHTLAIVCPWQPQWALYLPEARMVLKFIDESEKTTLRD